MPDKKLKILYIDFAFPYLLRDTDKPSGGAATEWLSWIEGIKSTGNEIGVLTWKGAKQFIDKDLNFDIVESFGVMEGIRIIRFFYVRFPKLFMAIKKYNPDVIIQMGSGGFTFMGAIISKILGKTFIYRLSSDLDADKRIKKKLNKKDQILYKIGLKNTDIILCLNEYQYRALKEKLPNKKIFILNPPFCTNKNIRLTGEKKGSFITWMGNSRYEKNISALVPIAKSLPDINFKITGTKSSNIDKSSLEALKILETLKNVEFMGYMKRSEILPFLSNAIALLNTSYLEGFPLTFLEAWSLGIPVISTKNVNPNNVITKNKLGAVAESYDDLPEIIRKIVNASPDESMGKRCRDYVEKYHNPEILAGKLVEIIRENLN